MDQLAHLETFVAVADLGGVTRAAESLALPQPLVSRRVQALERAWGIKLFERTSGRLTPTTLGEFALPYARDIVRRARHLDEAIATARAGVVHAVAIPPGCPPRALARLIEAADAAGQTVALHETTAAARREGLSDGRFSAALLRVAPTDGTGGLCVPTGLARAPSSDGSMTPTRPVHLDSLRPRRGGGAAAGAVLLLSPEDDVDPCGAVLRRACARAGIGEASIRGVASTAAGAAQVIASGGALLCDARTAADAGLVWAPLADATLHRGYEFVAASGGGATLSRDVLAALAPHVAAALGAAEPEGAADQDADAGPAARGPEERLAARGA